MTWINILAIAKKDVLSKLILNILELQELHSDYPLAPDKVEIKREMLSEYQLNMADLYNILISNVKELVPNFLINKSMCFIMKTWNFTWASD